MRRKNKNNSRRSKQFGGGRMLEEERMKITARLAGRERVKAEN